MSAYAVKKLGELVAKHGEESVRKFMRSKGLSGTTVDDKIVDQIEKELASQPMKTSTPTRTADDLITATPYKELQLPTGRFETGASPRAPEGIGAPGEKSFRKAVDEGLVPPSSSSKFPTRQVGAAAAGLGAGALALSGDEKSAFSNLISGEVDMPTASSQQPKTLMDSIEEAPKEELEAERPTEVDHLSALKKQIRDIKDPKKVTLVTSFSEDMELATKKAREFLNNFEKEENKLALREVIEKVTQAAAQMGAAMHAGDKYDASGLKFNSSDWEKKADRLNDKFNKAISLLDSNDKAARRDAEKQAELDAKYEDDLQRARQARVAAEATVAQLEQRERETRANEALAQAEKDRKAAEANAKLMANAENLGVSRSDKVQKELRDILQSKASDKEKKAAISNIVVSNFGLNTKDVEELAGRTGWFGTSPSEFVDKLTGVLDQTSPGGKVAPPARDPVIQKFANDNNESYALAKKTLIERGYQPNE